MEREREGERGGKERGEGKRKGKGIDDDDRLTYHRVGCHGKKR